MDVVWRNYMIKTFFFWGLLVASTNTIIDHSYTGSNINDSRHIGQKPIYHWTEVTDSVFRLLHVVTQLGINHFVHNLCNITKLQITNNNKNNKLND
jgi:hypothetical protein